MESEGFSQNNQRLQANWLPWRDSSNACYTNAAIFDTSIPCSELLALANTAEGSKTSDVATNLNPANAESLSETNSQVNGCHGHDTLHSKCSNVAKDGRPIHSKHSFDLNSPPPTEIESDTSTGLSIQFAPVTPDQSTKKGRIVQEPRVGQNETSSKRVERKEINLEKQTDTAIPIQAENHNPDKGATEGTNLNRTTQQKPKKRKHRPKVVIEGQPKRTPKTPKQSGSSTENPNGLKKYVRRKHLKKPEEASETIEPMTEGRPRRSCRQRINFSSENQAGEGFTSIPEQSSYTEQSTGLVVQNTELMVEKAQLCVPLDFTCSLEQVSDEYLSLPEKEAQIPSTPAGIDRTPVGQSTSARVKCRIHFSDATHDKEKRNMNHLNCDHISSIACFDKGKERKGLKRERSSDNVEMGETRGPNGTGHRYNFLETYLPTFTGYSKMRFPVIYKKKRTKKGHGSIAQNMQSSKTLAQRTGSNVLKIAVEGVAQDKQQAFTCLMGFSHEKFKKKRTKCQTRMRDMSSFLRLLNGGQLVTQSNCTGISRNGGLEAFSQPQTCMEALATDIRVTKKRTKRNYISSSLMFNSGPRHRFMTNFIGPYVGLLWKSMDSLDSLIKQFKKLSINESPNHLAEQDRCALIPYRTRYQEKNALVLYRRNVAIVPFRGLFNPDRRRKPRPKVDLDDETTRVWKLLLEDINSEGIDGSDEDKAKWWEEERGVFSGRADSFIARMRLVQGDRRFSRWKGSVVDSVIGVFLTQNVSDHLSSSAFISLAARFPLKSTSKNGSPAEKGTSISLEVTDLCEVDLDKTMGCHDDSTQPTNDQQTKEVYNEERVFINSNEFEVRTGADGGLMGNQRDMEDIIFSQNSLVSVLNSTGSSNSQTIESIVGSPDYNIHSDFTSFMELLNARGTTTLHGLYYQGEEDQSYNERLRQDNFEDLVQTQEQEEAILNCTKIKSVDTIPPETEHDDLWREEIRSPNVQKQHEVEQSEMMQIFTAQSTAEISKKTKLQNTASNYKVQQITDITSSSEEISDVTETSSIMGNSPMAEITEQKSVETILDDKINHETTINGTGEGISKAKGDRVRKAKRIAFRWDSLRKQTQIHGKTREKTPATMDSLDYEAVRHAHVDVISDTIKQRGMNNMLAERIKDFLNRLVKDHGSIDLEWLRDVPPDKAKEYLLSIRGLGLKSVECVRLLTLHHLAFPVDTNVGRIAVRLGWVPLQPLPESLQLHLLELYPILESIQKYLWPRLCKLDQRTLYELHYQMITFGKVFCTKSKPNCNACPMRGECRHFASAFASARLALPATEEKSIVGLGVRKGELPDENPTRINRGLHQLENDFTRRSCEPVIEEPASPEPTIESPTTPDAEQTQYQETDIEDAICEDPEEIPTIKLNMEEFTQNLQNYMQKNMELREGDMSRALVALTPEAASIPVPKLKDVRRLRTEHHVYELPDSHPLLERLDRREPDDPCPYLLAIWTPGETADSIQPPGRSCRFQKSGRLCNKKTCYSCNSIREANSQIVRGTLLIPCRTAMRGSFPLNGTYFQVNEVFADHASSLDPIYVPRSWIWNLPRRIVYFGTSISTIFRGLTTEEIQYCFWRGFVCVRGFDKMARAPRPLLARLHFPASRLPRTRGANAEYYAE